MIDVGTFAVQVPGNLSFPFILDKNNEKKLQNFRKPDKKLQLGWN